MDVKLNQNISPRKNSGKNLKKDDDGGTTAAAELLI